MPLNPDAVGAKSQPGEKHWDSKDAILYALGVTLAVVGWGYLVYAAIDFGSTARGGDSQAWALLALASVGAFACLFVALILLARISRTLGITESPEPRPKRDRDLPKGGKRAAR